MSLAKTRLSAFALTFVWLGAQAFLQTQDEPLSLATATRLKCVFPVMSTGTWTKEGDAVAEIRKSELTMQYEAIDTQDGTAKAVGFSSNFYLTVRLVGSNLHLIATDASGPVYVTTVFSKPSHPAKFKAVHTRHEFTDVSLPGYTSRPEQYIGECEIAR